MSRISQADPAKALKEQLSERDFKVKELEGRSRDLVAEITTLEEKLRVANRNARVLEEENSNYHVRIKAIEKDEDMDSFTAVEKEAVELIRENEELRSALTASGKREKESSGRIRDADNGTEKQIRALNNECEQMRKERAREWKELESTRTLCAELQRRLDEGEETLKSAKDLWEQERERYQQKIEELFDHHRKDEKPPASRSVSSKGNGGDVSLEQVLLKEEVAQLEQRLKEVQEKSWEKEKEWIRSESNLRKKLQSRPRDESSAMRNDQALFQAMKGQIAALQEEIKALRNDQRAALAAASEKNTANSSRPSPLTASQKAAAENLAARYDAAVIENEQLHDQLDAAKITNFELQNVADDKTITCKELEVRLAAAEKQGLSAARARTASKDAALRANSDRSFGGRSAESPSASDTTRTITELRQRIRELESELSRTKDAHEQKEIISSVRTKEYQKQVNELLHQNATFRGDAAGARATDSGLQDSDAAGGVLRLTRDKRDSVEEVMRLLEFAWDSEEEGKRQLRRAKYLSASTAGQDAAKEDEIRRMQKLIDDLETQVRALGKKSDDNDDLRDAVHDLRKQIRAAQADNEKLRKKNGDLEKGKDNVAKDQSARQRDADRRMEELQTEIDDLRRRLADARKVSNRPVSPTVSPRTPRVSARRRTPEVSAISQLSVGSTEEQRRSAVPEGAHLAFTVVEVVDVLRKGNPITEPGYISIKLKSIKEKYKTSVKELSSVIRFDETFVFYLAQPDQDVITVHVFYITKNGSREDHIGDACFSMATLYRGVPRQRIAPVVQYPGTKDARRAGMIEVNLQTDDFGKATDPTEYEIAEEKARFNELVNKFEHSAPEKLHAADVYMASQQLH